MSTTDSLKLLAPVITEIEEEIYETPTMSVTDGGAVVCVTSFSHSTLGTRSDFSGTITYQGKKFDFEFHGSNVDGDSWDYLEVQQ